MLSYDEFLKFYRKYKKFPNGLYTPVKELNATQLQTKYEKYAKSINKKKNRDMESSKNKIKVKRDLRWEAVREKVFAKKGGLCFFIQSLSCLEMTDLIHKSNGLYLIIDIAHVLPKDLYPELYYDEDNLFPLNRYSHSCIDNLLHPQYGTKITVEEQRFFWETMITKEEYTILLNKIKTIRGLNP